MDVSIGKVSDNSNYQNKKSKPSPCSSAFKAWNIYSIRFGREREGKKKQNKKQHNKTNHRLDMDHHNASSFREFSVMQFLATTEYHC